MIKNLTLLAIAGLFVNTGCVINTGTTETDSDTNNTTTTNNTTSDGTTTDDTTTDGTATDDTTTDDTTAGTTTPTTTDTPTSTTSSTTEGTTDDTTTGNSEFGKCGWDPDNKFYACGFIGADPDAISPIACPDELPAEGDPCDEMGMVTGVGCCLPDGSNYYCSMAGMIVIEACGG